MNFECYFCCWSPIQDYKKKAKIALKYNFQKFVKVCFKLTSYYWKKIDKTTIWKRKFEKMIFQEWFTFGLVTTHDTLLSWRGSGTNQKLISTKVTLLYRSMIRCYANILGVTVAVTGSAVSKYLGHFSNAIMRHKK